MIMLYLCGTNAHITVIIWNFVHSQLQNQIKQNLVIIAINRYFTNKIFIYLYLYLCIYRLLRESNNCKTGKLFRTPPINIQSSLETGSATKWTKKWTFSFTWTTFFYSIHALGCLFEWFIWILIYESLTLNDNTIFKNDRN